MSRAKARPTPKRLLRSAAALLLALLPSRPQAGERGPALSAGTRLTVGSGGYRSFLLGTYADWFSPPWEPFALAEFKADTLKRQLFLDGGAWRALDQSLRAKAGLGVTVGSYVEPAASASSVSLELGLERRLGDRGARVGADYSVTSGSIGGSRLRQGAEAAPRAQGRGAAGRAATAEPTRYTYHELAGYAGLDAGEGRVQGTLSLGLPSDSRSTVSETLGYSRPLNERLSLSGSVTAEQGTTDELYVSLGANYLF